MADESDLEKTEAASPRRLERRARRGRSRVPGTGHVHDAGRRRRGDLAGRRLAVPGPERGAAQRPGLRPARAAGSGRDDGTGRAGLRPGADDPVADLRPAGRDRGAVQRGAGRDRDLGQAAATQSVQAQPARRPQAHVFLADGGRAGQGAGQGPAGGRRGGLGDLALPRRHAGPHARGAFGGADARADHRRHLLRADRGLAGGDRRAGRALADLEPPEEAAHVQGRRAPGTQGKRGRPARQGAHPPAAAPGRAPPHDGRRAQGGRGGDQPHALCRGAAVRRIEERRAARAGQGHRPDRGQDPRAGGRTQDSHIEAPPLARALHQHVELGQEIPAELYTAVAEVLAWVFQLRSWRAGWGPSRPRRPACLCRPRWTRKPRPQLKESKE